ncbi:hypothetical protein AAHC03_023056 [Spirometra sp. Aus1]
MGVSGGRLYVKDAIHDGENGHIESTSAKIEDEHVAFRADLLVESESYRSGRQFTNNAQNTVTEDGSCVSRGLTLTIVEIRRISDSPASAVSPILSGGVIPS